MRYYSGEKDWQQLQVVTRMASDLSFPVEVVGCPIVRESDGLAMSSRNAYLNAKERAVAPRIHEALQEAAEGMRSGRTIGSVQRRARAALNSEGFKVDYVEARNAQTLAKPEDPEVEPLRLLAAAWLGKTRLIDNIAV